MREIKDINISFRATSKLKKELTKFCEVSDLPHSFVIRQALAVYLKRRMEAELPHIVVDHSLPIMKAKT